MENFRKFITLLEQDPMGGGPPGMPGGMPGMPGGEPGGMPGMPGGMPGGMDMGMGGGMLPGGGMGGPPGMDMGMAGGMPQQPMAPQQPAALTAKPRNVWEALETLLKKTPNTPVVQQQQQNPKPQLNFLKGVPGI